jgi:putative transposase
MARRRFKSEPIITMLREAEVLLNQGSTVIDIARKLGIAEQTYYRWRKESGSMWVDQAKRLKELELENARLKKLVADLSLDNAILKKANRDNFYLNRVPISMQKTLMYRHLFLWRSL